MERTADHARTLIERFGAQMLATARRYSASDEDAEDAYQRAAEIALRRRPAGSHDELRRWLRTTTKHEALAIRRQRTQVIPAGAPEAIPEPRDSSRRGTAADTHERTERLEQLRLGGEALRRLKPQEIRALQLRAEGYSYKEICQITNWSYTKVDRCLKEGRRAFLQHVHDIESGAECRRLAPHLSALAGDRATTADLEALRPHLATCLTCRAHLRQHRATPAPAAPTRVAAVMPATGLMGFLHDRWAAATAATHDRLAAAGDRLHQVAELVAGQKAAATVATAAALAGGGAVTVDRVADTAKPPAPEQRVLDEAGAGVTTPTPANTPSPDSAAPPIEQPQVADTDTATPSPPAPTEFGPEAISPPDTPSDPTPNSPPTPAPRPTPPSATAPGQFEQ